MIPKIIHYIWLGEKPKPPLVNICILSWQEKMPDYQIIEWNESNLDLVKIASENRFFAECRKRKMWAFMADYLRLKILYENGGIYMDTDMQTIKSLDALLDNTAFIGLESKDIISCGIIACSAGNELMTKILAYYNLQIWSDPIWTLPTIITAVLGDVDSPILKVYSPNYFYPFPYQAVFKADCITKDTFTIHWWAGSWIGDFLPYIFLCTKHINNPIQKFYVSIIKAAGFYFYKIKKTVQPKN